jgi:3-methyladenine DNA glycosylase AlkD
MANRRTKTLEQAIAALKASSKEENRIGMARFGVETSHALGVPMPVIRAVASTTIKDHSLAIALWESGIHEARILASLLEEPKKVTRTQMESWVNDFASWDVCDQVCGNLFDRLPEAEAAIFDWSKSPKEFVKRAAFALIAWRAVHLKSEPDQTFLNYLPLIHRESTDPRNFVKKSVNWALRQIGKRNASLNNPAVEMALAFSQSDNKTVRWIGSDAYKELTDAKIKARLGVL